MLLGLIVQLRQMSGRKHIFLFKALPDGAPVPEDHETPNIPLHALLAISYTIKKYFFHRRPTYAQYDCFQDLMGGDPRWYRDALPKEYLHLKYVP